MNDIFQYTEDGYLNKSFYLSKDLNELENDFVNLNEAKENITLILNNFISRNFFGNYLKRYDLRSIKEQKAPKLKKTLLISLWDDLVLLEWAVITLFFVLAIL